MKFYQIPPDPIPERVLDGLEPVVSVDAEEVGSGQEALDVLVERVQDHEDRGDLLVQVLHHGQRHRLDQVVPGAGRVGVRLGEKKWFELGFGLTFRTAPRTGWPLSASSSSGSPPPWSRCRRCRRTPPETFEFNHIGN